jgi:hypothetical protein
MSVQPIMLGRARCVHVGGTSCADHEDGTGHFNFEMIPTNITRYSKLIPSHAFNAAVCVMESCRVHADPPLRRGALVRMASRSFEIDQEIATNRIPIVRCPLHCDETLTRLEECPDVYTQ